jgi:hypothetical protein
MRKPTNLLLIFLLTVLIAGCGGGGNGDTQPPPVQAPSNLSYAALPALTVNTALTEVTPTVSGTGTSFTVAPALPAGLALNPTTGAIGGTPTAVSAAANYTITASNAGGSSTAVITITVNDVAPGFSYSPASFTFSEGVAVTPRIPSTSGGAIVSWSVQPGLPLGLTLDPATGAIGGIPAGISAHADYVVRAENSGGTQTQTVSIAVQSSVLFTQGHLSQITTLLPSATRLFTMDSGGDWTLWNYPTGEIIAHGRGKDLAVPGAALGANTLLVRSTDAIESRDATTGDLIASVPFDSTHRWWALSPDGTWFAIGGTGGITTYNRSGSVRATRSGNYGAAVPFAESALLRLAKGASGTDVLEFVDPATGSAIVSPQFLGTFHSWFADGQNFFSNTGNTVRVYSLAAAQQDIAALPTVNNLYGSGSWYVVRDSTSVPRELRVYRVGDAGVQSASYEFQDDISQPPMYSGRFIAVKRGGGAFKILDVGGAAIIESDYTPPSNFGLFAATDAQHWFLAHNSVLDGVSIAGTVRYIGNTYAWEVVGSPQRFAIRASDGIRIYNTNTRALERTIPLMAARIRMTDDGGTLAALAGGTNLGEDRSIRIYSLAAGNEIFAWPYTYGTFPWPQDIVLSGNGATLVQMRTIGPTISDLDAIVTPTLGGASIASFSSWLDIQLSPDGTFAAVSVAGSNLGEASTNLYENGALQQAVPGIVRAWFGNDRLMTNTYQVGTSTALYDYETSRFFNRAGSLIRSQTMPSQPYVIQPLPTDEYFDPYNQQIVSTVTGQIVWIAASHGPDDRIGAVAGSDVVFVAGRAVRIEPR